MLPGGIALDHAATRPIRRVLRWMCSGASSRMPFGAVTMPDQTGSAAWHMLQRDITISSTLASVGCADSALVLISRGPAAERNKIAIAPAAATPHTHHGDLRPACRSLKKWRITGPSARMIATMIQLKRVA